MNTKDLVLNYFNSWQEPADFDEMKSYLADDVTFDGGDMMKITGSEALKQVISANPDPWSKVTLLRSYFGDDEAILFYQGKTSQGNTARVAEYMTLTAGKISSIVAIMDLPKPG